MASIHLQRSSGYPTHSQRWLDRRIERRGFVSSCKVQAVLRHLLFRYFVYSQPCIRALLTGI